MNPRSLYTDCVRAAYSSGIVQISCSNSRRVSGGASTRRAASPEACSSTSCTVTSSRPAPRHSTKNAASLSESRSRPSATSWMMMVVVATGLVNEARSKIVASSVEGERSSNDSAPNASRQSTTWPSPTSATAAGKVPRSRAPASTRLAAAIGSVEGGAGITRRRWHKIAGTMHVLGIDAGGTKTVCLLADELGVVVAEERGPGANLQTAGELEVEKVLHQIMETALGDAGKRPAAICLGIAGVDRDDDLRTVTALMRRISRGSRVLVVNDALIALEAGARNEPGIVLISGTGSTAAGRNRGCAVGA